MKPVADKTQSTTLIPLIINPKSVDLYHDAALLSIDRLSQADNIILDDGMIEKVPGTVKVSAGSLTAAAVMGLHRTYSPAGTKMALKLYNGTLYSTTAPSSTSKFATTVLANLATNKRTPWTDIRGKAYGINETDGIIRYDAKTAVGVKTGIVGPFLRKKIAFFEDDELWTTAQGGSQSTIVARPEEWQGKSIQAAKLICLSASYSADMTTGVALNLTAFDDGKTVTDEDMISFYTFHSNRTNISALEIRFGTKGFDWNNSFYASLDQALFEQGDHAWTKWNIRRGAFSTLAGTPDWSKVSAVGLIAKSNTVGGTSVFVDYMYLKPSPPKPYSMRKNIFKCEGGSETWTGVHNSFDQKIQHEGLRSVKLIGDGTPASAACVLGSTIDFTKWGNGASTSTSDEFVFHIRETSISALTDTNPLIVRVGSQVSSYYSRTYTKLSALGLTGKNQWVQIRIPKERLSAATGGTPNWAAIKYTAFVTSNVVAADKLYIDDCYFEQKTSSKQLCTFESGDEAWGFTGNGAFATDSAGVGKVTEGLSAVKLWSATPGSWSQSYADLTVALDLTVWTDGGNSDDNDNVFFNLYHTNATKIDWVEIWFATTDLDNAYKYRVEKTMFGNEGKTNNVGVEVNIKKEDFDLIGVPTGWNNVTAVRFVVYSKGGADHGAVYIDNLQLKRNEGLTGRYYYKYIFKVGDVASASSEDSDYIDMKESRVSIVNISTSQDSRVTSREIYRMGGTYPDTWGLVKILEDNTVTEVIDDVNDDDIVYFLGNDVPLGWVNSVLCNNVIHDPYSDRALYWGDPTYKNRVYFSHEGFYHVVDEAGYREFPDDVQNVVPWFGQTIFFYKHKIQKITGGDITTGMLIDIPVEMGACSYWAVGNPWNGMIPYVGQDNVYLFDGIRSNPIGDDVKNYFKGRESYLSTVNVAIVKDTIYIACKDKTGTPTYNDTVLRCYLPSKSWTVLPDWNVNVWANFDKQDDNNDLFYGDSVTGNAYSINSTGYQFAGSNISVDFDTGWLSFPEADIAIHSIEFKAKGTAASTLTFKGYINNGSSASTQGTVTMTAAWQVFRLGPKGIHNLLRGNNVKVEFTQATQNAWFKMKDIVIYTEKLPERVSITTANEVACAAP